MQALWLDVLGAVVAEPSDDFFDLGGGSLTAAQLVSRLRERFPEVTVADVYEHPRLGDLAARAGRMAAPSGRQNRDVRPVPVKTQVGSVVLGPAAHPHRLRWLVWIGVGNNIAAGLLGLAWLPARVVVVGGPRAGWCSSHRRADAR